MSPSTSNYHGLRRRAYVRRIHRQSYLIIPDSLWMPSVLLMNTWAPNCYRDSLASLYTPNTWAIIRPLDDCRLADEYHSLNHYINPFRSWIHNPHLEQNTILFENLSTKKLLDGSLISHVIASDSYCAKHYSSV